jgi:radical SAM superfamily enzyme YgiQ (UPF0313 family)
MSNLGIRIIYSLLNEYCDVVCERVFMPAPDMVAFLGQKGRKLFSLETKTDLDKFEVVGFNLGYELNITNVLKMLHLGAIPLMAEQRHSIVMVGGVANPEPFVDFVDVFFLGEFEESSQIFVQVLREHKDKNARLEALGQKEGFYVPGIKKAGLPIRRVYLKNLDAAYYPRRWLVPGTQIVHDRAQIEISRGCPNCCTFCQARQIYFPYRERSPKTVEALIRDIYSRSGYENISFLSLSASDHSAIEELIDTVHGYLQRNRIGLSLPSLRVDDIIGRLYKKLTLLKKTSLTVAVEAASDTLRQKLNKKIDITKLFEAADVVRSLKIRRMKVYFMFGLPGETDDDLVAIGRFLRRLSSQSQMTLNVSINVFVPKPFSLWEKAAMPEEEALEAKRALILKHIPRQRNINVSINSIKRSIAEALISRADRRFSRVILRAYEYGACFDGYREGFDWDIWREALRAEGIDYRRYLEETGVKLAWSFIETQNIPSGFPQAERPRGCYRQEN